MLSQMQFNIQYEDALNSLGEIVNAFEKLSFIRIIEVLRSITCHVVQCDLDQAQSIEDVNTSRLWSCKRSSLRTEEMFFST